jgi:hypothetical protein
MDGQQLLHRLQNRLVVVTLVPDFAWTISSISGLPDIRQEARASLDRFFGRCGLLELGL